MKIALTGGIGCGKSRTLAIFESFGFSVLSADCICREIIESRRTLINEEVYERWGFFYSPQAVSKKVFADPFERRWLESLLHPLIETELEQRIAQLPRPVIVEIPLLFEAGWESRFDFTLAVWAPEKTVRERIRNRHWTEEEISARLQAQFSAEEKLQRVDFGLINSGSELFLESQCREFAQTETSIIF